MRKWCPKYKIDIEEKSEHGCWGCFDYKFTNPGLDDCEKVSASCSSYIIY